MPNAIIRGGRDAFVNQAKPSKNFSKTIRLRVVDAANDKRAFLFLKSAANDGQTVSEGTLRLVQSAAFTGTVTITARRVSASWKARLLTWNNQPGVVGVGVGVTKVNPAAGTVWEFDVTDHLQTVADGSDHYGWRLASDSSTEIVFYSLDADRVANRPRLEMSYSTAPTAPSTLIPDAGKVSVDKPTLQFDYTDNSGSTELASVQVQIDAAQDGGSPDFDSGEVATDVPELDLSTTAYGGVSDGATTYWRVRVKDGNGLWSDWSDWATLARDAKGTLVIDSPTNGGTVLEYTPPILHTLTGETQTHARWRIFDVSDGVPREVYNSGKIATTDDEHTIPFRNHIAGWNPGNRVLFDQRDYRVQVDVWDTKNREATAGDPTYTSATANFTVAYEATVTAPATLVADQVASSPWVELTWTRASAPDSWTIERDGEAIEVDIDPSDVFVSGTTYSWRDPGARPGIEHTYRVRAEVNGELSDDGPTDTITTTVIGVWVIDPESVLDDVPMYGKEPFIAAFGEDAEVFNPIGAQASVRIVQGMRGLEGSWIGQIVDHESTSWHTIEARLMQYKARPAQEFRLVWSDTSIPVYLGNVSVSPDPISTGDQYVKAVGFDFWQSSDLPFDAEL